MVVTALGDASSSSSSEMEENGGYTTVRRRNRRKKTDGGLTRPTSISRKDLPPAIMIRAKPGGSYADTVAAVKAVVSPADLDATVRRIRRSQDCHAIVEFDGAATAHAAAGRLKEVLVTKTGDVVGLVVQLGNLVEAEVVDIDPTATEADVLEAIRAAASQKTPELVETITLTELWPIKAGIQVATAKMDRRTLVLVDKIKIG